jgi:hypothetical protein
MFLDILRIDSPEPEKTFQHMLPSTISASHCIMHMGYLKDGLRYIRRITIRHTSIEETSKITP